MDDDLIINNLKLIKYVIRKMGLRTTNDDIYQEWYDDGLIGLIQGVKSYDENRNIKLSTFLCKCIRTNIARGAYLRNMDKRKINYMNNISLNAPVSNDKEIELIDVLKDKSVYILEDVEKNIDIEKLKYAMKKRLSPRDYEIWCKFYGLFGYKEYTTKELEREYNISHTSIWRIVKGSNLNKIKYYLKHFQCYEWNEE